MFRGVVLPVSQVNSFRSSSDQRVSLETNKNPLKPWLVRLNSRLMRQKRVKVRQTLYGSIRSVCLNDAFKHELWFLRLRAKANFSMSVGDICS